MSRERFAEIIVATIILLGTNAVASIFLPGGWLGYFIMSPALVATIVVGSYILKKRFTQALISMAVGLLGAALIVWLPSFFFGDHYFNSWLLVGLGAGYLLAGLFMKAWERRVSVSQ